jgi:hypothetical protein
MKKRNRTAATRPSNASPSVNFERIQTDEKQSGYDRIADRVMKAVEEFNAAIKEAHECAEMRVFISVRKSDLRPMQITPIIYRLTHTTLLFTIKPTVQSNMEWRVVKDPSFQDAAGQGFGAIKPRDNQVTEP